MVSEYWTAKILAFWHTHDSFNPRRMQDKDSCVACTVAFEHSVLRVWEIYALENVVIYVAVYGA